MSCGNGRFVWQDLMSTDVERAIGYFGELFGWQVSAVDMGEMGTYSMIHAGGLPIGGVVPFDPPEGLKSHWIGYVSVHDVDQATEAAAGAGGVTCVPPTDIPNVGRFAVVTDPGGAAISPFKFTQDPPPPPQPTHGHFCWNELLTTDPDAVVDFYASTFGWTSRVQDMGEMGPYTMFAVAGVEVAGVMRIPEGAAQRPLWLPYVKVTDLDRSAADVARLGGRVWVPPSEIPTVGRFAVTGDPTGALIGLFS